MSTEVIRVLVLVAVIAVAFLIAAIARKLQRPVHPDITVGDAGSRPGVVLFTSTDCGTCKEMIALLKHESIPFREITYDLEPQRFEAWVVLAVPLCVILDEDGIVVDAISGVAKTKRLHKSLRAAGVA